MREMIVQQFKRPHGVLGRLAGWIMAHRGSNRLRNEWVISILEIEPEHRVLEIGCGPGLALEHAAKAANRGLVVGVDHSELMVQVAAKRNAAAVSEGRVEVAHGTVEDWLEGGRRFDRVYAVNVAQFWDSPEATLRALHDAIVPGGWIGVAFQPRNQGATDEDARRGAREYRRRLEAAGFEDVRVETLDLKPMVVCVLGRVQPNQLERGMR